MGVAMDRLPIEKFSGVCLNVHLRNLMKQPCKYYVQMYGSRTLLVALRVAHIFLVVRRLTRIIAYKNKYTFTARKFVVLFKRN